MINTRLLTALIALLLTGSAYAQVIGLTVTENGTNATLSWPLAYPRFSLQTTTNLETPWQLVSTPTKTNGNYQITQPMRPVIVNDPIIPHRFFRLKEDASENADPRLGDGKFIVITTGTGGQLKNMIDTNAANANRIINTQPSSIDARAFVDPSDPNGTNQLPLQFHWVVRYPTQPETPYTAAGMKGYFTPVLTMDTATLAQQPSPPSVNGRGVAFTVEVYSPNSGRTAVYTFQAQSVGSALTLQEFNTCQLETEACDTCPCTKPAALPTNEPN